MAVRYQNARLVIAAALAASVIGGTAYFAESSTATSSTTTTSQTELAGWTTITRAPQQTNTVRRTRAS